MIKLLKLNAFIDHSSLYNNELENLDIEENLNLQSLLNDSILSILAIYDTEEKTIQYLTVDNINSEKEYNEY